MINYWTLTYFASQGQQKHSVMDAAMYSLEAYSETEYFLCQLARTLETDSSSGITSAKESQLPQLHVYFVGKSSSNDRQL